VPNARAAAWAVPEHFNKEKTMQKPKHHIFICGSFRTGGEAKGICHRKDSTALIQHLQTEVGDRNMEDVLVSSTGCMNLCEHGPLLVVYPEAHWYGEVNEEKIDAILDALEQGQPASELMLA
jgi:(2Fe-2S) ferredoxin